MRMRRAKEDAMQSFGGDHVGHEESPAKQQPAILNAPKWRSNALANAGGVHAWCPG
jgi:hypothetical protein